MGQHHENNKAKLFKTQLGSQVAVNREGQSSEAGELSNRELKAIGDRLNPMPKSETYAGLKYLGSAAVHIYYSEPIGQAFFITQRSTLGNTNELLAIAATKDFVGSVMEYYGKKRQKLRSGF